MSAHAERTEELNSGLISGLVDAVFTAQANLDFSHNEAVRRAEERIETRAVLGRLREFGLSDLASQLLSPQLAIAKTQLQARVYFSQSEYAKITVGIGMMATPIEAYYEASYGSTLATESTIRLELERVPLSMYRSNREVDETES